MGITSAMNVARECSLRHFCVRAPTSNGSSISRCNITLLILEPFDVGVHNLHYHNGRETHAKMMQRAFPYDIHSGSYSVFQGSKLTWTDFS